MKRIERKNDSSWIQQMRISKNPGGFRRKTKSKALYGQTQEAELMKFATKETQ